MDARKIFTFIYPLIDSLSKGTLIRKVMFLLFGIIGVLSFFGGVYFFFKTVSYVPDFWTFILLLLFVLASFLSLQIWFYRAEAVSNLEDSEFTVIPIFSNFFRALGENYALFLITVGIGGTLMLWFSNYGGYLWEFSRYIPFVSLEDSFFGGLFFLVLTILLAFLFLLITYFIAENILALAQIAKNTSCLKKENNTHNNQ